MNIGRTKTSNSTIFETFSDMVFCVVIVTLLLVTILALNINEEVDNLIAANRFTGGLRRPALFLDSYLINYSQTTGTANKINRNLFKDNLIPLIILYSKSSAKAQTKIDWKEKKVTSQIKGQTWSGEYRCYLPEFAELLCGIKIDSFKTNETKTSLLIPNFPNKNVYINADNSYMFKPNQELSKKILSKLYPSFNNPTHNIRAYKEYRNKRVKIYIESKTIKLKNNKTVNGIIIGQKTFLIPQNVDDNTLSFLTTLSSPLTEVIYLGHYTKKENTDKRLDFFKRHGYIKTAENYKKEVFPNESIINKKLKTYKISWNDISGDIQNEWINALGKKEAKKRYKKFAFKQIKIIESTKQLEQNDNSWIPSLMKDNEAWNKYCSYYESMNLKPPKWLIRDFLVPLGFNKRIIRVKED